MALLANAATIQVSGQTTSMGKKIMSFKPQAFMGRSPDVITPNHSRLQRSRRRKSSSSAATFMRGLSSQPTYAPLNGFDGVEYLVEMCWGSQSFQASLDTGSSDTWLVSDNLKCIDFIGLPASNSSVCGFGPGFRGKLDPITNSNGTGFFISYADGTMASGTMGTTMVTLGGITVPEQEVAVANESYWNGHGVGSGLVGLAYPALTDSLDSDYNPIHYDPVFTTMVKNNLTAPTFALALMRGESGGYLSFGGLPPVSVDGDFVSTPIELYIDPGSPNLTAPTFYTITPDAIVHGSSSESNLGQYIVDSGTTLVYAPTSVAKGVALGFNPPGVYSAYYGGYVVDCNAEAPPFGITIGMILNIVVERSC